MTVDESAIRARYAGAGQDHVLKNLDLLSAEDKESLLEQLDAIRVEQLADLLDAAGSEPSDAAATSNITPFSKHVGRTTNKEEASQAYARGIEAIARGEVAALVLAGGQGTRLGFDGPKGMYDIGLPSGRTLFQLLTERLKRLQQIASSEGTGTPHPLPFYIMTSPINHQPTIDFFKEKNFFGLRECDVLFFQQGMLPCLTNEGKIIMETAKTVAMAPDG
jgi:UDP-N-acetylglucosamine/UDP-N-acetylgalactosamine diphosphorylase